MSGTCILVRDARYPIGGLESWTETLAARLPGRGIETVVIAPGGATDGLSASRVVPVETSNSDAEQAAIVIEAAAALAREGLSGVFVTMGYPYLSIVSINLLHSPWIPLPVIHGTHAGIVEWVAVGPPRRIVCVSPRFAEICRSELALRVGRLRSLRRVVEIENGVPLPEASGLEAKFDDAGGPLRLVAVTRLDPVMKRPHDYLAIGRGIASAGLNARLTVLGSGPAEQELRALLAAAPIGETLEFRGAVSREEVYAALRSAHAMVIASEAEASSLAVAEAMANGCAILATRHSVSSTVARSGAAEVVDAGDIDAFVRVIREWSGDRMRVAGMGGRARELAERAYSSEAMVDQYAELMGQLLRHAHSDRGWSPERLSLEPAEALPRRAADRVLNYLDGVWQTFTT